MQKAFPTFAKSSWARLFLFAFISALVGLILPPDMFAPAFITVFIVLLWMTETLPLPVTGLLVPILAVLFGVLAPAEAFAPFGSEILFLFIGAFILTRAMQKHQLDVRLAYWILAQPFASASSIAIVLSMSTVAFLLSMWIPNTAAAALMVPIAIGVLSTLKKNPPEGDAGGVPLGVSLAPWLLLAIGFGAGVGGVATPVGSPPNLIALQNLSNAGITISFFQWISIGLPIALVLFVVMHLILRKSYGGTLVMLSGLAAKFRTQFNARGSMTKGERWTLICFLAAVFFWTVPGMLGAFFPDSAIISSIQQRFSLGVVALAASLPLFFLPEKPGVPTLAWDDAAKIDWGTVILFGGGLALGAMMIQSGFAEYLALRVIGTGGVPLILLGLIVAVLASLISAFGSNTASAAIIVPILLSAAAQIDTSSSLLLVFAATFGASFGFLLPVSTPPNAIVYSTGSVSRNQLLRSGAKLQAVGIVLVVLFIFVLYPLIGLL